MCKYNREIFQSRRFSKVTFLFFSGREGLQGYRAQPPNQYNNDNNKRKQRKPRLKPWPFFRSWATLNDYYFPEMEQCLLVTLTSKIMNQKYFKNYLGAGSLELMDTSSVKLNMQSKPCVYVTARYFSLQDFPQSRFYSSREGRDFRGTELNPLTKTSKDDNNKRKQRKSRLKPWLFF